MVKEYISVFPLFELNAWPKPPMQVSPRLKTLQTFIVEGLGVTPFYSLIFFNLAYKESFPSPVSSTKRSQT